MGWYNVADEETKCAMGEWGREMDGAKQKGRKWCSPVPGHSFVNRLDTFNFHCVSITSFEQIIRYFKYIFTLLWTYALRL